MILETICVGPMQANCYILAASADSEAIIIDPGGGARKIKQVLDKHRLKPAFIINTHGHYDHIGADNDFGVAVYVHKDDSALLKEPGLNLSGFFSLPFRVKAKIQTLEDGQAITQGSLQLKVLHIPGHTPGGIALLLLKPEEKALFTGDTLFCGSIGRWDLAGGDEKLLIRSIREKLFVLPDETAVYPGHGSSTTIGEEKKNNPFCSQR